MGMKRRQRRALEHAARRALKEGKISIAPATGAEQLKRELLPRPPEGQPPEARNKRPASPNRLQSRKRKRRRILAVLLAAFGAIGSFVTIYAGRPFVSMSTSTRDDACSFACSHFVVTNSSPFPLHGVTVRCFPQKLAYSDEFTLAMSGLDTINPPVKTLESGEAMVVKCGYMLRHFIQPGVLCGFSRNRSLILL
jgi:hypothetical protein